MLEGEKISWKQIPQAKKSSGIKGLKKKKTKSPNPVRHPPPSEVEWLAPKMI